MTTLSLGLIERAPAIEPTLLFNLKGRLFRIATVRCAQRLFTRVDEATPNARLRPRFYAGVVSAHTALLNYINGEHHEPI